MPLQDRYNALRQRYSELWGIATMVRPQNTKEFMDFLHKKLREHQVFFEHLIYLEVKEKEEGKKDGEKSQGTSNKN